MVRKLRAFASDGSAVGRHGVKPRRVCAGEPTMMAKPVHEFLSDEAGGGTIWGLLWFILLVGIGGMAVDTTNAYRNQTMMQATADAAAHAGVQSLPDEVDAVNTALEYAEKNMASADYGELLAVEDVDIGIWDVPSRTFTPLGAGAGALPNAVRVTLRSTAATGNAVPVNFLRIAGLMEWNITVQAVAVMGRFENLCLNSGFLSNGMVYSGSTNDYVNNICIHGDLGVKIGSTNTFESGVSVSMINLDDLVQSQENVGLPEALNEQAMDLPLTTQIPTIVAGLMDGSYVPPGFITEGPVFLEYLPSNENLVPGTLYVIEQVVDFGSNVTVSNIAVVSHEIIKSGSNVAFSNVLLASTNMVTLGSESLIGATDYCDTGIGEVHIFSGPEYSAGSQSAYSGVQLIGGAQVKLGSELLSLVGINVQAREDLFWGSAENYGGCDAPNLFGPVMGPLRPTLVL